MENEIGLQSVNGLSASIVWSLDMYNELSLAYCVNLKPDKRIYLL